jgi:hypothetical protein
VIWRNDQISRDPRTPDRGERNQDSWSFTGQSHGCHTATPITAEFEEVAQQQVTRA